jgi:hypothetical protein
MNRLQEIAASLLALATELRSLVEPPVVRVVATVEELVAALAAGGEISMQPGIYTGNFIVGRATKLTGLNAQLVPADPLLPTLQVTGSDVTISQLTIISGAPDRECVVIGNSRARDAKLQPNNVTLSYVSVIATAKGGHRGVSMHGSNLHLLNCTVRGFWQSGQDAQAVWINNGPGPYTVEGCYLEASGENILVGGDVISIPDCVPSDIQITSNICFKPEAWRTNGATVKNSIELKVGRRVRIVDNLIDGNWRSGQDGTPILLTTRNPENAAPWTIIDDVVLQGNTTRRCTEGFAVSILGMDDTSGRVSQQTRNVRIEHNLFQDSPNGIKVGNAVVESLVISSNTMPAVKQNFLQFYDTRPAVVKSQLVFAKNVVRTGAYGISGAGFAPGTNALFGYANVGDFTSNVIEASADRNIPYPPGNTIVAAGKLATLLDDKFKLISGIAGY